MALCVATAPMNESWNSESQTMKDVRPPDMGELKFGQAMRNMTKNRAVDPSCRMSSGCFSTESLALTGFNAFTSWAAAVILYPSMSGVLPVVVEEVQVYKLTLQATRCRRGWAASGAGGFTPYYKLRSFRYLLQTENIKRGLGILRRSYVPRYKSKDDFFLPNWAG